MPPAVREERSLERITRMELPKFVRFIIQGLQSSGFEACVVGGAVRDFCLQRPALDWDVATSAPPDGIKAVFRRVRHFSLKHDTVTLVDGRNHYDVTTFRGAGDSGQSIEGDLGHRDFTINAMAYDVSGKILMDPYGGRGDISRKLLRAVGKPDERFREDPLRLIRAVRIGHELGFGIEEETFRSLSRNGELLREAAGERIREELLKILMGKKPSRAFTLMRRAGLLKVFLPELLEGYLKKQNVHHRFTVFRHIMETVDRVDPEPVLRLTALLHDIAKPRVRKKIEGSFRFYGHEEASASLANEIMARLKFSRDLIDRVTGLTAHHMIGYSPEWSDGAVRRLIGRVGKENIETLLAFRRADLLAHGIMDHKLELLSRLEGRVQGMTVNPLPLKISDLAIDGNRVMQVLGLKTGPAVGQVLDGLMQRILDDPDLNTEEGLIAAVKEIRRNKMGE
ncbi:MAG: HD domain-containing protein [Pseudomonadota bacterium]